MKEEFLQVKDFHRRNGFLTDKKLKDCGDPSKTQAEISELLTALCERIQGEAIYRQEANHDPRLYRMYLMLEELEEINAAMYAGDEVKLLDGIEDLLYVVLGTGVTFNMPVKEGWDEVHRSNMSKKVRCKIDDPRMRNKGSEYIPADFKGIIQRWKANNRNNAIDMARGNQHPNRFIPGSTPKEKK